MGRWPPRSFSRFTLRFSVGSLLSAKTGGSYTKQPEITNASAHFGCSAGGGQLASAIGVFGQLGLWLTTLLVLSDTSLVVWTPVLDSANWYDATQMKWLIEYLSAICAKEMSMPE